MLLGLGPPLFTQNYPMCLSFVYWIPTYALPCMQDPLLKTFLNTPWLDAHLRFLLTQLCSGLYKVPHYLHLNTTLVLILFIEPLALKEPQPRSWCIILPQLLAQTQIKHYYSPLIYETSWIVWNVPLLGCGLIYGQHLEKCLAHGQLYINVSYYIQSDTVLISASWTPEVLLGLTHKVFPVTP